MIFDRDSVSPRGQSAPADIGPAVLAALEDERQLDECEALLQNAIDMVRSPTPGSGEGRPGARAESVRSLRAKISGPSRFVRISLDPGESSGYVAKDTKSGIVVLRYQDSERLREMCHWLGWQVTDDAVPNSDK
jgi:hypothetical protein